MYNLSYDLSWSSVQNGSYGDKSEIDAIVSSTTLYITLETVCCKFISANWFDIFSGSLIGVWRLKVIPF
ncbi:hypothetical protein JTE90_002043 [Oedothorax gibbosus]|uniref:Uncharacterized protein n=1 Tax=Oedothorax gibbosus TaxID=931172 RepID=A0AAV6UNS1_9ARAC|nr:hypothetical protein JTE90_002043 [Oedothorax gibbosus]